jgi:beta-phosphoglucomutase-like phosphatase (HAD superfamily)
MDHKKLIIFDCDGVLVDSEIIANRIDAAMLTDLGYPISTEESIRCFTGMNAKTAARYIFEESGIMVPEDFWEQISQSILLALENELNPLMQAALSHQLLAPIDRCIVAAAQESGSLNR